MKVCCKDLMELPSFKNIKLIGGKKGLNRIVRCPYVTLTNNIDMWVRGGEFMFVSGIGYDTNEKTLLRLFAESCKKKLSGVVILTGPKYIKHIPPALVELADKYKMPLFEMPYRIPLVGPTEEISSYIAKCNDKEQSMYEILLNIFSGKCDSWEAVISKAAVYHYSLKKTFAAAILSLPGIEYGDNTVRNISDEIFGSRNLADNIFKLHGYDTLSLPMPNSVHFLIPYNGKSSSADIDSILHDIINKINSKGTGNDAFFSVGRKYDKLDDMCKSKSEAENTLKARPLLKNDSVNYFDDLGIFKILFDIKDHTEMERYLNDTLGALISYDKKNKTDLTGTLEIYLNENCNFVRASQKLFIHRNSLYYRVKKIEKITGYDFSIFKNRLKCRDAFLIKNFLRIA